MDTYSISGQIRLDGIGYTGSASVSISGGGITGSTTTSGSGSFTFDDLLLADYDITPHVTSQTLTPADMTIMGNELSSSGNIFDLNTYSLSGQVTLGASGYPDATVNLTGDETGSTSTDGSGNYSFANLLNGSYTLTPSVSGQSLNPAHLYPNISGSSISNLDFALNTWTISGKVTHGSDNLSGIEVDLTGATTDTTSTDGSGNFSFPDVLNGSYTVTPTAVPQTFSPPNSTFSVSNANKTNVNFDIPSLKWLVNGSSTATTQNGFSWPTAFHNLDPTTTYAQDGDQVWVAQGTYESTSPGNPGVEVLTMNAGVEYYGGFAGGETSESQRNPWANRTILDGQGTAEQIVIGADDATLDGFVVRNANPPADDTNYVAPINAAGVMNFGLINCIVASNIFSASVTDFNINGSALNIESGIVLNTIFRTNDGRNAPIYVLEGAAGELDIINTAIYWNFSLYGGGMVLAGDGPVRVLNSTIANNNTCAPATSVTPEECKYDYLSRSFWLDNDLTGAVTITNSIVYGDINANSNTPGVNWPVMPTITYTMLESFGTTYDTLWSGTGNLISYSTAGPFPNFAGYSGTTTDDLFFSLGESSACIDAGSNAAVPSSIDYDLIGNDRFDGTVDMGAYEYQKP
jgi:hypothetical protein